MPSTSLAQHNFMEGIAHGMKPRGGSGPSPDVAKEFVQADKGRDLGALPKHVQDAKKRAQYSALREM